MKSSLKDGLGRKGMGNGMCVVVLRLRQQHSTSRCLER